VIVGLGTVLADDPRLTARRGARRHPHRVILDERLAIPPTARVLRRVEGATTYVATTDRAPVARRRRLEALGAVVLPVKSRKGLVDFDDLLNRLGALQMTSVLIEGGSAVNASALRAGVVRKVVVMVAPRLLGGRDAVGAVGGVSPLRLADAVTLRDVSVRRVGVDFIVEGYL